MCFFYLFRIHSCLVYAFCVHRTRWTSGRRIEIGFIRPVGHTNWSSSKRDRLSSIAIERVWFFWCCCVCQTWSINFNIYISIYADRICPAMICAARVWNGRKLTKRCWCTSASVATAVRTARSVACLGSGRRLVGHFHRVIVTSEIRGSANLVSSMTLRTWPFRYNQNCAVVVVVAAAPSCPPHSTIFQFENNLRLRQLAETRAQLEALRRKYDAVETEKKEIQQEFVELKENYSLLASQSKTVSFQSHTGILFCMFVCF